MENWNEGVTLFRQDKPMLEARGIRWQPGWEPVGYLPEPFKRDLDLAMDAQPALRTDPSSAIPIMFAQMVDPEVYRILFAPLKAVEALGSEVQKGDWTTVLDYFPVVEATGEVSSYGDYNANGRAGVNAAWPQRESYLFQIFKEWGELELARMGKAQINYAAEIDRSAADIMARFMNVTYLYGVAGLQNYGLLNDPNLSAAITPGTKAAGGTRWVLNGQINATANEIYQDFQALYYQLIVQTGGNIDQNTALRLVLGNASAMGLTATNSFGVNVGDLLKKNFPNVEIVTVPQYEVRSASNPNGVAAGNFVQLIAPNVGQQKTGYGAFNEKMRSHAVVQHESSWRQKLTGGTWGAVIRAPFTIASMVGI